MENQEKQPLERNLSLCTEENGKASDPRLCQSAVKLRPYSGQYFPIPMNIEEEIRLLKEDKKRASDEARLKSFLYESVVEDSSSDRLTDSYTDTYKSLNETLENKPLNSENHKPQLQHKENKPLKSENSNPPERKSILQEMKEIINAKNESDLGVTPMCTPAKARAEYTPKPAPRIQCSIDVSSFMKTPLNRPPVKIRPVPTARRSDEERENSPMMRVLFKKICVNDVNYIVLKELGRGGSSCVYHCFNPKTEIECAIKCVDLNQDQNAVTGYINEVKTLYKLQHCKRVIKMYTYQILKDEKKLYVVLEKGGEDLSSILKQLTMSSERLSMYTLIFYWMEMLYAVKEIHSNGVIHSDLKPANFLEASGKIKLIDFGISSCVQHDNTSVIKNVTLGTFSYISPEALRGDKSSNFESPNYGKRKFRISYKSDVWSLGCILYQLVYRRTPFQHLTHMWAKLSAITDPNHQIEYPHIDSMSAGIIQTIKDCLQYDMQARPSIDDLISKYGQYYC